MNSHKATTTRSGLTQDQRGYSLVELSISAGLLGLSMLLVANIISYIKKNENYIITHTGLMEMKSLISMSLSPLFIGLNNNLNLPGKRRCRDAIVTAAPIPVNGVNPPPPGTSIPLRIRDPQPTSAGFLIQDGEAREQVIYRVTLENFRFVATIPAVPTIHPILTNQFIADIVIQADRARGFAAALGGSVPFSFGQQIVRESLPLTMEFTAANALDYCTP